MKEHYMQSGITKKNEGQKIVGIKSQLCSAFQVADVRVELPDNLVTAEKPSTCSLNEHPAETQMAEAWS